MTASQMLPGSDSHRRSLKYADVFVHTSALFLYMHPIQHHLYVAQKQRDFLEAEVRQLQWADQSGSIDARDAANGGVADAIAHQILQIVLKKVKNVVGEPDGPSSKPQGLPGEELDSFVEEISKAAKAQ